MDLLFLPQSSWWSNYTSERSCSRQEYRVELEVRVETMGLGRGSIYPKILQLIIWTTSHISTACISICLCSGTTDRDTNTWFQHSLLQTYRFRSNSKLVWLTVRKQFASYRGQKEEEEKNRTTAILKFPCLKLSTFNVNNTNVDLHAVGS